MKKIHNIINEVSAYKVTDTHSYEKKDLGNYEKDAFCLNLWKSLDKEPLLNKISDAYLNFEISFFVLLNCDLNKHKQRLYSHSLNRKLMTYYNWTLPTIISKHKDLCFLKEMTLSEATDILKDEIGPKNIFLSTCFVMLDFADKEANSKVGGNPLKCVHHRVSYRVRSYLSTSILLHALNYMITRSKRKITSKKAILSSVKHLLISNEVALTLKTSREYLLFLDGIESIFQSFVRSGIFQVDKKEFRRKIKPKKSKQKKIKPKKKPKPKIKIKRQIEYTFPAIFKNQLDKFIRLPQIKKPEIVTESTLEKHFISSKDYSSITISSSRNIVNSLNLANKKRFSINMKFVKILELLEKSPDLKINRPIPSTDNIKCYKNEIEDYKSKISKLFNTSSIENIIHSKNRTKFTIAQNRLISKINLLEKQLLKLSRERNIGNKKVEYARKLNGFAFYFTNGLAATTRVFAQEYTFSRHIGCLKLLRGDYRSVRVSINGILHILTCYYSEDRKLSEKFKNFVNKASIEKKRLTIGKLEKFYSENRIDYESKESVTHFMLLSSELQSLLIKKTKKTNILLQIDQVASGLVFLSILFQNEKLAIHTSIDYKKGALSPYYLAMSKFEDFYNTSLKLKNEKVLEFLKTSKKLHKFGMMCYCYNQTQYGRVSDFAERWKSEFGKRPTNDEWECLREISEKYPEFLNTLFPGLNEKINILNEIVELVVRDCGTLKIKTIDCAVIKWEFFKKKTVNRHYFNPQTLERKSYNLKIPAIDKNGELVPDVGKFKTKFLSYLVHSFDAAIMRQIQLLMFKKHNYQIDQLFDCVLLSPNEVDNFYSVLEEIYSQDVLKNYMNSHVFEIWRSEISDNNLSLFESKVLKFNNISGKYKQEQFNVNVRKMYTFEV